MMEVLVVLVVEVVKTMEVKDLPLNLELQDQMHQHKQIMELLVEMEDTVVLEEVVVPVEQEKLLPVPQIVLHHRSVVMVDLE